MREAQGLSLCEIRSLEGVRPVAPQRIAHIGGDTGELGIVEPSIEDEDPAIEFESPASHQASDPLPESERGFEHLPRNTGARFDSVLVGDGLVDEGRPGFM